MKYYYYFDVNKIMNNQILKILLTDKRVTGTHIKIYLLIAIEKILMQSQTCELLLIKKQTINKMFKDLLQIAYIKVQHVKGRNKYLIISNYINRIKSVLCGQE